MRALLLSGRWLPFLLFLHVIFPLCVHMGGDRDRRQERGKREHGFLVLLIGAVILSYQGLILNLILPERSQIQLRGFRASACGFGGTLAVNNTSSCVFQQSSPL